MKRLQQFSFAVVLTLLFSVSTFAGEIGMPKAPPPPDSSAATTPGEIPIPAAGQIPIGSISPDSVAAVALNMLQTVLSVF